MQDAEWMNLLTCREVGMVYVISALFWFPKAFPAEIAFRPPQCVVEETKTEKLRLCYPYASDISGY